MTKAIILCQTLIQFNTKITQFTLANMPKLCAKQSTWTNLYWDKQGLLVIFTIYVILDSDLKKLQIMQLIICLLSMMLQISRKLAYVKIRIWQKADYGCLLDSHMGTLPGVLPKMRYKYGIKKAIEGVYCNDVSWVGCGAVKGFHIHWISWSAAKLTTTRLLLCSSSSMPANRNLGKVTGQRSSVNCCLMFALVDSWISHTCNGRTDTAPVRNVFNIKLEQLERLRSDDTSLLPTVLSHVGSHVKTRSNDLEDIGQGQRSSHAIHHLMLVIVCTTYGKNPSETVDATERTQFSSSRPNDLEDIGQGQRSLYATHTLILVIICATYGKNPLRTVDSFFKVEAENFQKFAQNSNFQILKKNLTRDTPSNDSDHLCQI